MKYVANYLKKVIDEDILIEAVKNSETKMLPLYLTSSYDFRKCSMLGTDVWLLCAKDGADFTPEQLEKQKETVETIIDMPVIFVFDKVASYNIKRYIERRLNFIVPEKQLFIPALLMDIRKTSKSEKKAVKGVAPMAQLVLFYHLQKSSLDGLSIKDVAERLAMPYININRAINNLKELGLCNLNGAKEKIINFGDKIILWDNAVEHLINPIQKTVFTDSKFAYTRSGINALAHYTMLNDESREYYALFKDDFRNSTLQVDELYGYNAIEVWKYNPTMLSEDGYIDRLSLFALYKDDTDERIQIELKTLIAQMKW